jgi:WD40 repeat protein
LVGWLWDMKKPVVFLVLHPHCVSEPKWILLWVVVGQVISAGLDKKILFWDMRMAKALAYSRNLGAEVESMSLFGFNLMVVIGASIYMYDLRNLDKSVQSRESHSDNRIRCVSSIPYSEGIITVISFVCCNPCSCYCGWRQPQ